MSTTLVLVALLLGLQSPPDANSTVTSVKSTTPPPKARQDEPARPEKLEPVKIPAQDDEIPEGHLILCAERPTDTWSAIVCGNGGVVIEAGVDIAAENGEVGDADALRCPVLLRYGVSSSIELFAFGDLLISREGEDPHSGEEVDDFGYGDLILGTKWGLLGGEGALPGFGTIAYWKLPTAATEGLGSGEGDLYFLTALTKTWDNVMVNGNLGVAFISEIEERDRFLLRSIASLEVRIQFNSLTVFGEINWLSNIEPQEGTDTSARVGGAFFISDLIRLDISGKFGISTAADDFTLSAGFSFMLGA
jgi:Putative MetA-pathway of phenol degradation